jgi:predicted transcriptional regulator
MVMIDRGLSCANTKVLIVIDSDSSLEIYGTGKQAFQWGKEAFPYYAR